MAIHSVYQGPYTSDHSTNLGFSKDKFRYPRVIWRTSLNDSSGFSLTLRTLKVKVQFVYATVGQ